MSSIVLEKLGLDPRDPRFARIRIGESLQCKGPLHVLRGVDELTGASLVLKMLVPHPAKDSALITRFRRELELLQRFDHPRVVPLFLGISGQGIECLILPELEGGTLREHLGDRAVSPRMAVVIVRQLLEALEYIHGMGILHRDIKPENLVFARRTGQLRLIDFDAADSQDRDPDLSQEGSFSGSPDYASPEQVLGAELGPTSDLYSVGVILYELLTGVRPIEEEDLSRRFTRQLSQDYLRPRMLDPRIPSSLEELVEACLEPLPDRRIGSARAMRLALDEIRAAAPALFGPRSEERERLAGAANFYRNVFVPGVASL